MALTPKQWAAGTALVMALTAIVVLPPRPDREYEGPEPMWYSSEDFEWSYQTSRVHREAVGSARDRLRDELTTRQAADSIVRLAAAGRGLRSPDGLVTILYDWPLTRDSAAVWLGLVTRELATLPGAGSGGVPIIVNLAGDEKRETVYRNWTVRRRLHRQGARANCVVELHLSRLPRYGRDYLSASAPEGRKTIVLDWCGVYARFGEPGPYVGVWSDAVNWPGSRDYWRRIGFSKALDDARAAPVPRHLPSVAYRSASCARGAVGVCGAALDVDRPTTARGRDGYWWYNEGVVALPTRSGFLASLLVQERPERFAALWRSPLPVRAALTSAYGHDADSLIMTWMQTAYPSAAAGPQGSGRDMMASFSWSLVLLGVGMFFAMRQQVRE